MTWSRTARPGCPGVSALRERLPELVAAARRHHRQRARHGDAALLAGAGLAPLAGGRNNDVYACTLLGVRVCLKFHRTDGRRRAEREWRALGALAARGYADAPRPLHYEPEPDPVVAMTLVPGSGLGQARLDQAQLDALAGSVRALHAVTLAPDGPAPLRVSLEPPAMLERAREFWEAPDPALPRAYRRLAACWAAWARGPDPERLAQVAPPVLGQADGSLANCLWDGRRVRLVEFEYAGWSDAAYELALIVEHVQSRNTPDPAWAWFVERYGLPGPERPRYEAARRLACLFWAALLLERPDIGPGDPRCAIQAERVRALLGGCRALG